MRYSKPSYLFIGVTSLLSFFLTACQADQSDEKNYDCSADKTLAEKANTKPWSMSQSGKSGKTAIYFSCESSPFVGDFQQCDIQLKYNDQPMFADAIAVDGGMRGHGHGLPTVPTLAPTAKPGHYLLKGLKYSMPGAWTVGFRVSINGMTDQVIFDFTI